MRRPWTGISGAQAQSAIFYKSLKISYWILSVPPVKIDLIFPLQKITILRSGPGAGGSCEAFEK